jgi:hypothetical protein
MRKARVVRVLTFVLLLFAINGSAASSTGLAGQWVFTLGSRTLFILSISTEAGQNQLFHGSLSHPRHFQTGDSWSFSHIYGEIVTEPIVNSAWKGDSLSITVQNPQDPSDRDTLFFSLKDGTHAQVQYDGIPFPPMSFIRAQGTRSVATDWDRDKTYSPDDGLASNPEMKRIYDEDQRVRQPGVRIDWASVNQSDAERRQAVMKLLDQGSLHTAEDFTWAAFVFQHGSTPDDYLLAHTLAIVALRKGGDALWIAAAALDRYLHSIHQPQIYGTQFSTPPEQPTTQEPYNRTLISDPLRRQLGVPIQSAQEEERKRYDAQRGITK